MIPLIILYSIVLFIVGIWFGRQQMSVWKRSAQVKRGLSAENLAPLNRNVWRYHPRDARHLGSPVDYVVFDGMEAGVADLRIVLVEVKTGNGAPSRRERMVRAAVIAGRVDYEIVRIP